MLNRYAFFRNQVPGWGTFGGFLAQYSQTLQPFLRHWASAKDFVAKCNSTFDNPVCQFKPTRPATYPGTKVPMGQLKTLLALQATPWASLPEAARRLALQTLTGQIPNPVGNATEVADTKVYYQARQRARADARGVGGLHAPLRRGQELGLAAPAGALPINSVTTRSSSRRRPGASRKVQHVSFTVGGGTRAVAHADARAVPHALASVDAAAAAHGRLRRQDAAPGTVEDAPLIPDQSPRCATSRASAARPQRRRDHRFAVGNNPRYAHRTVAPTATSSPGT